MIVLDPRRNLTQEGVNVKARIVAGWIRGKLPGPNGPISVVKSPRNDQKPWSKLVKNPPNLCLHTTEGGTTLGDRYKTWEYPPNFACGDGKIVQLFPFGYASEAVDTKDGYLLQVELAYRVADHAPTKVYLPPASTLDPLVALTAFLHKRKLITTGLERPNKSWPLALDKLPAASDNYYRRKDGTWPKNGVYGHVELPDDEHYDPASFDYPKFFDMVKDVLEGDVALTKEQSDGIEFAYGQLMFLRGDKEPSKAGPRQRGWRFARDVKEAEPVG